MSVMSCRVPAARGDRFGVWCRDVQQTARSGALHGKPLAPESRPDAAHQVVITLVAHTAAMKRHWPWLFLTLNVPALAGGAETLNQASAFEVSLTRAPCFGFCPAYTVRVDGAGRVRWQGDRFVERIGPALTVVDANTVQRLRRAVRAANVFTLEDEYLAMPVTDLPYMTIEVRDGARRKTIRSYAGDPNLPDVLVKLAEQIDRELSTSRWIGRKTF